MSNKFESFLSTVGTDFMKGLGFAVKEAPLVGNLVTIFYPGNAAVSPLVTAGLTLLQNSILTIEQKYAASGAQSGTGEQKAAEVLALSGPAVTQLLTAGGVKNVSDSYVQNLVTAIVGILNATQPAIVAA